METMGTVLIGILGAAGILALMYLVIIASIMNDAIDKLKDFEEKKVMGWTAIDHCAWCGKDKGILLDRRMKEDAFEDMNVCSSLEPCEECEKNMATGFTFLIMKDERPKGYTVIKLEAAKEMIDKDFFESCKDNKCFVEYSEAIKIGIIKDAAKSSKPLNGEEK